MPAVGKNSGGVEVLFVVDVVGVFVWLIDRMLAMAPGSAVPSK